MAVENSSATEFGGAHYHTVPLFYTDTALLKIFVVWAQSKYKVVKSHLHTTLIFLIAFCVLIAKILWKIKYLFYE